LSKRYHECRFPQCDCDTTPLSICAEHSRGRKQIVPGIRCRDCDHTEAPSKFNYWCPECQEKPLKSTARTWPRDFESGAQSAGEVGLAPVTKVQCCSLKKLDSCVVFGRLHGTCVGAAQRLTRLHKAFCIFCISRTWPHWEDICLAPRRRVFEERLGSYQELECALEGRRISLRHWLFSAARISFTIGRLLAMRGIATFPECDKSAGR
jgi:hypothetical protein